MSSQGVVLDIDTQFLDRLRRADDELRKIVGSVDNVTTSFTRLLATAGGQNKTVFADLAKQFEKIGSTKVTANVDTSQLEKMMSTISDIAAVMGSMSASGKQLFDTKGIADSNANLFETEKALDKVNEKISLLRKEWSDQQGFMPPINNRTGVQFKEESKTYQNAKNAYMSDVEAQLKAELEKKAILTRELEFAKMTQDEKAQYIQKKIEQMLSEEKAFASKVQKEYLDTVKQLTQVGGKYDKASAKNKDGSLDPQLAKYEARFTELNAKRMQMEQQYGAYVYEVAAEAQSKIADLEIKRILDRKAAEKKANEEAVDRYRSTPTGALQFAGSAQTVNEMREAMKYLQTARDNTNTKDIKTIDELNRKYLELRATVESLTTAEKNENSLQPSIRNEYIRLLRELEKIADAKKKLGSITPTWENYPTITESSDALEAREKDIQNKIATIRAAAGEKLAETDNQYRAERAERDISEEKRVQDEKVRIARQKYQESLNALMEIDRLQSQVDRARLTSGGTANTSSADAELARQRSEVAARIEEIERKHADAVQDIRDKHNRKRIQADLDADRQRLANTGQIDAQIQRIIDNAQKMSKWGAFKSKFSNEKLIDTASVDGAVAAINKLKEARDRLNKDDFGGNTAKYQRALNHINQEIQRQETYVERLRASHTRLKKDAEQLKSVLQRVFGLAALKSFASKLVSIRGEFEMQQKSLEVLLRNKGEADLLWQRTIDLAVKSPYTTQQLVTATKQLAAYRVESHKLYSTTKMLTDISAGLGVEINRLVLAYGQVKAANFLRGTELRQFSEAGVNLLDELAARFTDIEGKVVTVKEVFDRISKRMVSFADVEAVLQNITSSGGAFFNMQEQQSETLKGQILNLKDSIELMFNDMGKTSDGTIKKIVSGLKWMVDHWKQVATVIGPVLVAFLGMKAVIGVINGIRAATLALNKAMMANPILFWVGAASTLITTLWSLFSTVEETNEQHITQADLFTRNAHVINGYSSAILELTNRRKELLALEERSEAQNIELESVTRARSAAISELTELNKEYARSLREAGDEVSTLKSLMEEEQTRQNTTRNFITALDDIDISALDNAMANMSRAKGKFAAVTEMAKASLKDLEHSAKNSNNLAIRMQAETLQLLADSNGDIEEFYKNWDKFIENNEYYKNRLEYQGMGEDLKTGTVNVQTKLDDPISEQLQELYNEAIQAYHNTTANEEVQNKLREAIKWIFPSEQLKQIKDGLAAGEGTPEYANAIRLVRLQYLHIIQQAGEQLGPYGETAVRDIFAELLKLPSTWLADSETVKLDAWAESYNNALKSIVDEASGMYNLLKATEQDSVNKKISALKQEQTERESLIKTLAAQIVMAKAAAAAGTGGENLADLEAAKVAAEVELKKITSALSFLGSKGSGRGGSGQDRWVTAVKTINDVYKAYSKLSKKFSKDVATQKLWEQWGKVVDENLKKIGFSAKKVREQFGDLNTEESLKKALEYLSTHGSAKGRKEAIELLAEIQLDLEIKERDSQQEKLNREIERMFSGYEISLEIADLNIPKDFASKFFDMDIISLDELRKKLFAKKGEFTGDEGIEEYNKFLSRLNEMEAKAQQDKLKKYLEFTKQSYSEQGQILVDTTAKVNDIIDAFKLTNTMAFGEGIISELQLNMLNEAGKTITEISDSELKLSWGFTKEDIAKLKELKELLREQRDMTISKTFEEKNKQIQESSWKSFKESNVFSEVFSDLEDASDSLLRVTLDRLNEFKEAWAGLDMKEYRELIEMISELEQKLASSTPVKTWRESGKDIKEAILGYGDYALGSFESEEAQDLYGKIKGPITMKDYDRYTEALQAELAYQENIVAEKEKAVSLAEQAYDNVIKSANATSDEKTESKALVDSAKNQLDLARRNRDTVAQTLSRDKERRESILSTNEQLSFALNQANKLYGAFKGLAEVLVEDDSPAMIFADMGMQMMDTVLNAIMLNLQMKAATAAAFEMGVAMKSAVPIIGWIVMAVELIAMGLKAVFDAKDNSILKDIDREQKAVSDLQKGYEELERSMEEAYLAMDMGKITREMNNNLEQQKAHLEEMIELENERKKPDQDKIDGWEDDMDDINQQIADNTKELFSSLTNGIIDNVLDATRTFVDAWYEAFKETGNGMSGLKDSFKDMLLDMLKQQAATTLISPFIEDLQKQIYDSVMDDNVFDADEARATKEMWDEMAPQIDESLKNYFEAFEGVLGQDGGELSDLQKGVQGMTEEQAEVLAAYWNSCRFMLSNIDTNLAAIAANVLGGSNNSNPVVEAIQAQTLVITDIKEMFASVIGSTNYPSGGSYIKTLEG